MSADLSYLRERSYLREPEKGSSWISFRAFMFGIFVVVAMIVGLVVGTVLGTIPSKCGVPIPTRPKFVGFQVREGHGWCATRYRAAFGRGIWSEISEWTAVPTSSDALNSQPVIEVSNAHTCKHEITWQRQSVSEPDIWYPVAMARVKYNRFVDSQRACRQVPRVRQPVFHTWTANGMWCPTSYSVSLAEQTNWSMWSAFVTSTGAAGQGANPLLRVPDLQTAAVIWRRRTHPDDDIGDVVSLVSSETAPEGGWVDDGTACRLVVAAGGAVSNKFYMEVRRGGTAQTLVAVVPVGTYTLTALLSSITLTLNTRAHAWFGSVRFEVNSANLLQCMLEGCDDALAFRVITDASSASASPNVSDGRTVNTLLGFTAVVDAPYSEPNTWQVAESMMECMSTPLL